jgi:protein-S-isoprenylcysteine O-methyltransferase Ste14
MNQFSAYAAVATAILIGGGSLLLFGTFLIHGPFGGIRFNVTESRALIWDGALSLLFFLQHSGMIRESFRARLSSRIPRPYHAAVYAIASGVVLAAVVLLWQTSPTTLLALPGSLRWLPRAFSALAVLAFIWGVRALRVFDPFGRMVLLAHLRGRRLPTLPLVVRGPYLWVRHPLYSCMLVLIWSVPEISLDRFVFNALWTAWIVLGTIWEERDLVVEFGDRYRHYQQTVPMLLPWRGSAGRQQSDS